MAECKQKLPLISIITVSFNAVEFIDQTIKSVLSQDYPNIEYIVIDGGSSDGTVDIIRNYAPQLAYWHSKPDRGLAHAFNLGLAQSHGDWIGYFHADDFFWEPSVITGFLPYFIKYSDVDVLFGEVIFMTCDKEPKPQPLRKNFGHPWRWQEFRRHDTLPHQGAFTSRRYFERVGLFDETFNIAVDYELFLRGGKDLKAQFIPIKVAGMRDGGISRKNIVKTYLENRVAQRKNHALPKGLDWLNFGWRCSRYFLGRFAHRILDPLASYINRQDRNKKKIFSNI